MDLSVQEYKVAEEVARGFSEKEIAEKLFISPKTVHNHTYNIRKKLKCRNAVDIARQFILSLDNPKQFFTAIMFLGIHLGIVNGLPEMELRRITKTSVRTSNSRRRDESYKF